jgi:hypothetical protein
MRAVVGPEKSVDRAATVAGKRFASTRLARRVRHLFVIEVSR